jgi:hypothetical protein
LTLFGVAAVVVLVEEVESVSCKTPAAAVDPALTLRLAAVDVPALVSGALTATVLAVPEMPGLATTTSVRSSLIETM